MSLIVGICGGSGSGKTTLTNKIYENFLENAVVIPMDNYYKDFPEIPFSERIKINYDHIDTFENELLIEHLTMLKNGKSIEMPLYDYTTFLRKKDRITVHPKKLILVEGILLFAHPELVKLFDVKIFVDTDADVRILRRILRDVKLRGRNLDWVVNQYLTTAKPMHETFVEPSKKFADVIVPEGGNNEIASDMIIKSIGKKLDL